MQSSVSRNRKSTASSSTSWTSRQALVRTVHSRLYDYQRARVENQAAIQGWIRLVQSKIQEYGIVEHDIYNVDETRFLCSRIASRKVIAAASRRARRARRIQPGARTWITAFECVRSNGEVIQLLIIFPGKSITNEITVQHLPQGSMFTESNKVWTSDEITLRWLQQIFEPLTHRCLGTYRLLILDGHRSLLMTKLDQYCQVRRSSYCVCLRTVLTYYDPSVSAYLDDWLPVLFRISHPTIGHWVWKVRSAESITDHATHHRLS